MSTKTIFIIALNCNLPKRSSVIQQIGKLCYIHIMNATMRIHEPQLYATMQVKSAIVLLSGRSQNQIYLYKVQKQARLISAVTGQDCGYPQAGGNWKRVGVLGGVGNVVFVDLDAGFMHVLQKFIKPFTYHMCLFLVNIKL